MATDNQSTKQTSALYQAFQRVMDRLGEQTDEVRHYSLDEGNLFWIVGEVFKEMGYEQK